MYCTFILPLFKRIKIDECYLENSMFLKCFNEFGHFLKEKIVACYNVQCKNIPGVGKSRKSLWTH